MINGMELKKKNKTNENQFWPSALHSSKVNMACRVIQEASTLHFRRMISRHSTTRMASRCLTISRQRPHHQPDGCHNRRIFNHRCRPRPTIMYNSHSSRHHKYHSTSNRIDRINWDRPQSQQRLIVIRTHPIASNMYAISLGNCFAYVYMHSRIHACNALCSAKVFLLMVCFYSNCRHPNRNRRLPI